ncbi:uncharacterized protein LOC142616407 [Castanea sativa]|uniref:uncharacterized protein LOC142616407 n=1 Tax=Castanea sativa TaxID=21020 RepID=UPI003F64B363
MWLLDERCAEMVEASWSSYFVGHHDSDILRRVEIYGRDLAWWNYNNFGNVRELKEEINILLDREARMWSQRSCAFWLKNGDNNTKFFHCRATKRHRKNKIQGVMDSNNIWRVELVEISLVLVYYYRELFSTSRLDP